MSESDRRQVPRTSLFSGITLILPDGDAIEATAFDIGRRGISVWAQGTRPQGLVRLSIPIDDGAPPISVDARVVREFESDGGAVWGLEFVGLSEHDAARIDRLVQRSEAPEP